jgi:hypothetical protein
MARDDDQTQGAAGEDITLKDPETDSQFADSKRLAAERKTEPGVDPATGERASINFRTLFNKFDGDEAKARAVFNEIATAGGYGRVGEHQDLDLRSLGRSVEENKKRADVAEDLFARRKAEQQGQHQDNLHNAVREILRREGLN